MSFTINLWWNIGTHRYTWITKESGLEDRRHEPLTRAQVLNIGCRRRSVFTTAQYLRLLLSRVLANVLMGHHSNEKCLDSLHVRSLLRFASSSKRLPLLLCPAHVLTIPKSQRPFHLPHTSSYGLSRMCTHTHTQTHNRPFSCSRCLRQTSLFRIGFRRPLSVLFPPHDKRVDDVF